MGFNNNRLKRGVVEIKTIVSNLQLFILVYIFIILVSYLLCILIPETIGKFKFNLPAVVYIISSVTAVIMTTWGDRIGLFIARFIFKNRNNIQERSIDQKKIRFLLILIYFISIVIFTLASLMTIPIFNVEKMDYSIIQSFATYIAYDRMVRNYPTIATKQS